jgi:membrane protein required for colicin V production
MKLIELMVSGIANGSAVRPVDKLLGFGFGAVKGVIMAVLAFSVLAIGYDTIWGASGRPGWITTARSYPFINASSGQLVKLLEERRRVIAEEESEALKDRK